MSNRQVAVAAIVVGCVILGVMVQTSPATYPLDQIGAAVEIYTSSDPVEILGGGTDYYESGDDYYYRLMPGLIPGPGTTSITITGLTATETVVCVGGKITLKVSAYDYDGRWDACSTAYVDDVPDDLTYTWKDGMTDNFTAPNAASTKWTAPATVPSTTPVEITVEVNDVFTRTDRDDDPVTKKIKITVVEVSELQTYGEVGGVTDWVKVDGETIWVWKDESVTIKAIPNPNVWPPGKPTWSEDGGTDGNPVVTVDTSASGTKTFTAICCSSSKTVTVKIVDVVKVEAGDKSSDGTTTEKKTLFLANDYLDEPTKRTDVTQEVLATLDPTANPLEPKFLDDADPK